MARVNYFEAETMLLITPTLKLIKIKSLPLGTHEADPFRDESNSFQSRKNNGFESGAIKIVILKRLSRTRPPATRKLNTETRPQV